MIGLDELEWLTSAAGERVLAGLVDENLNDDRTLPLLSRLRRDLAPSQAGAALELARLRRKAVTKFGPDAARMVFTADALEQASDPLVRAYRAPLAAGLRVVDACCGIGADALAFAAVGADVTGVDLDPVRVAMARFNAEVLGLTAQFIQADVREPLPPADLIFFDPARRTEDGNRIYSVESYKPPLSTLRGWDAPRIIAKLAPGVDTDVLARDYGGRVEFISVEGALKEATLHLGEGETGLRAVLLLPEAVYQLEPDAAVADASLSDPLAWLLEPDPAVLRAGVVKEVAAQTNAAQLDETIAYLTSGHQPESVWVRAWRVLDWLPFGVKPLRAYLRERGVGRVTVKKRGSAVTPETLIPQLKLKGTNSCTLVLTRLRGQQIVLICDDIPAVR